MCSVGVWVCVSGVAEVEGVERIIAGVWCTMCVGVCWKWVRGSTYQGRWVGNKFMCDVGKHNDEVNEQKSKT